ncbi:helix-turn-helix domain-containing protein [Candidatus Fermentibacteria bacterium]|nr:helix-turn-helix domain-containing protein [Candidatus Fermentibacteria bacterium]
MASDEQRFGEIVRELRKKKGISLRKFSAVIGVSPAYLSKIERDEFAPPAEEKVRAIAEQLNQDPDELLALAGRISSDLPEIIMQHPREFATLLRTLDGASREELRRFVRSVGRSMRRMEREEEAEEEEPEELPDLWHQEE